MISPTSAQKLARFVLCFSIFGLVAFPGFAGNNKVEIKVMNNATEFVWAENWGIHIVPDKNQARVSETALDEKQKSIPDHEKRQISVTCNGSENITITQSLRQEPVISSDIKYKVSALSSKLVGKASMLDNGRVIVLKDQAIEIAKFLYENQAITISWQLKNKEFSTQYDVIDFKRLFDYTCGSHPQYSDVSSHPVQPGFVSVCRSEGNKFIDENFDCKRIDQPKMDVAFDQRTNAEIDDINKLFELLESEPAVSENPIEITILGTKNRFIQGDVQRTLTAFVKSRSLFPLARILGANYLRVKLDVSQSNLATFEFYLTDESARLLGAVEAKNKEAVETILTVKPFNFVNLRLHDSLGHNSALNTSLFNRTDDITKLLIEAGASPKRSMLASQTLLQTALYNDDNEFVELVLEHASEHHNVEKLLIEAIAVEKTDMVKLLLEVGADPDKTNRFGWDALMQAMWTGNVDLIEHLISVSNPYHYSLTPVFNWRRGETLVDYPAPASSLILAQRLEGSSKETVLALLRERMNESEASEAVQLSELLLNKHLGYVSETNGELDKAMEFYTSGIEKAKIQELTSNSDGVLVATAIDILLKKHQIQVLLDQDRNESDQLHAAHIVELGGWNQPYHDMLSTFANVKAENVETLLADWTSKHIDPKIYEWDYTLLEQWVQSKEVLASTPELTRVLEFFAQKNQ